MTKKSRSQRVGRVFVSPSPLSPAAKRKTARKLRNCVRGPRMANGKCPPCRYGPRKNGRCPENATTRLFRLRRYYEEGKYRKQQPNAPTPAQ